MAKMADFSLLKPPRFISRKIYLSDRKIMKFPNYEVLLMKYLFFF